MLLIEDFKIQGTAEIMARRFGQPDQPGTSTVALSETGAGAPRDKPRDKPVKAS